MASPDDRRYLETHEWHKLEGDVVTIGLSRFAVDELTDITYVEIAKTQGTIQAGEAFGEIESVKATSDLYVGVDGAVTSINQEVVDDPSIVNDDPYGRGWLIKVTVSNTEQLESLLTAQAYDAKCGV